MILMRQKDAGKYCRWMLSPYAWIDENGRNRRKHTQPRIIPKCYYCGHKSGFYYPEFTVPPVRISAELYSGNDPIGATYPSWHKSRLVFLDRQWSFLHGLFKTFWNLPFPEMQMLCQWTIRLSNDRRVRCRITERQVAGKFVIFRSADLLKDIIFFIVNRNP